MSTILIKQSTKEVIYSSDSASVKSRTPSDRTLKCHDGSDLKHRSSPIVAKTISNGFVFNILCIGETACGKSSLLESLFNTSLHCTPSTHDLPCVVLRHHRCELVEGDIRVKLTLVETAGFGDQINKDDSFQVIGDFLDEQFQSYLNEDLKIKRNLADHRDTRIHVCLYFLNPTGHSLKTLDLATMKHIDGKVNIIPVIARADTLSKSELQHFKQTILDELNAAGVNFYRFPTDDEMLAEENRQINNLLPLAIVSSNDRVKVNQYYVRVREYPWGTVQVENDTHCDFKKLRTALIERNMLDLIETTHSKHYETFRRTCLMNFGLTTSIGEKAVSIGETLRMKIEEIQRDFDQAEQRLRDAFAEKIKKEDNEIQQSEQQMVEDLKAIEKNYKEQLEKFEGTIVSDQHGTSNHTGATNKK